MCRLIPMWPLIKSAVLGKCNWELAPPFIVLALTAIQLCEAQLNENRNQFTAIETSL